jgi:hypothetical protein
MALKPLLSSRPPRAPVQATVITKLAANRLWLGNDLTQRSRAATRPTPLATAAAAGMVTTRLAMAKGNSARDAVCSCSGRFSAKRLVRSAEKLQSVTAANSLPFDGCSGGFNAMLSVQLELLVWESLRLLPRSVEAGENAVALASTTANRVIIFIANIVVVCCLQSFFACAVVSRSECQRNFTNGSDFPLTTRPSWDPS